MSHLIHSIAKKEKMNSSSQAMGTPKNITKKKKNQNPESKFHFDLNLCSKNKDLRSAVSLYETAVAQSTRLNHHHCNSLLYLCSNSVADPSLKELALEYGFCIFHLMLSIGIAPNEATITAVARLAAAKGDGDYAFELVKSMGKYSAVPRLRTYDPALYCFCENLKAEKAYEVEKHMALVGVIPEEDEIAALLKVSSENDMEHRVYGYLHKLRNSVRCVGESTGKIIGDWFLGRRASEVGELNLEVGQIKEAVLRNGGGWHGLGWIGKGDWVVRRTSVDSVGECCSCTENLVCVDIDNTETERFAQSVASLAMEREVKSNFGEFQHWLEEHDDYEVIVDGANIGLYQQNFSDGGFSVSQLEAVVRELYNKSGKKWPLVVLHNKRFHALAENPLHRKLFEEWKRKGGLYTTPNGSNDDWYWLYATVKLKCLLVTNDEMRDHIFELLGTSLFLKWKERHQVRYTFVKGNLKLQMPPPYSSVIQESEKGTWHIPLAGDCSSAESERRSWLCITRPSVTKALYEVLHSTLTSQNGDGPHRTNDGLLHLCTAKTVAGNDSSQIYDNDTTTVMGKRKERSLSGPSP